MEKDFAKNTLVTTVNEPVRRHETFAPKRIFRTPKGELVVDFGQNLIGFVTVRAQGPAGTTIKLQHAEVLDKAGNFYTDNLRSARQQNAYTLRGTGAVEVFEPHFSWQGFQYVKIDGYPGELKPEHLTAVALYSDMAPAGTFTTSNPLLNQLQRNIVWGQKDNFLDVPTDCPQRDERLGWVGDAQVFARTATFNLNVNSFFAKWLRDVAADQLPDGNVPPIVPMLNPGPRGQGSAGWADVTTVVPWDMYVTYADDRLLREQYPSMKAWVDCMARQSKDNRYLWNNSFHFGDWLFYSVNDDRDGISAITNRYLIAQCFFAHSTQLLINAARALGKPDDVAAYTDLLQQVKAAFLKEYVTGSGALISDTQTAYVLALQFDMLPEELRQQAADRLARNVAAYKDHLTTGFLGTPYLCHALSRYGYTDVAFRLLLQESFPSWLYPVKMGATTIWERWDGILPDGTFQTPAMNSFNHYAYGAIGDWLYRVVAGLDTDPAAPGYKQITIRPHVGGNLTSVAATFQTYYGPVSSGWKTESGKLLLDVTIPANTAATVYVPATRATDVQVDGKALAKTKQVHVGEAADGYVALKVGSGTYHFTANR